jgi:hypothetical protein
MRPLVDEERYLLFDAVVYDVVIIRRRYLTSGSRRNC